MYNIGDYIIYLKDVCKILDIKEKYMNNTELLDYEKELLYIILLIPPKLSELDSEFDKVKEMVIMIHKLNIFNNLK